MTDAKKNDATTCISFFKQEVEEFIQERGWKKYHLPKNLIQALQIEVSELSELFLFKDYSKQEIIKNKNLYKNVRNEVADIFIYLISIINALDIDLTRSFMNKMAINMNKYSIEEFNEGKYYKK